MRINGKTILAIGLVVAIVLCNPFSLSMLASVPVTSGWNIYDQETMLTVDSVSGTGITGAINVDPDGANWHEISETLQYIGASPVPMPIYSGKPTVHSGISAALSLSATPPESITGWDLYRYVFGLVLKTSAAHTPGNPVSYEQDEVTAATFFTIGLQAGALDPNIPQAKIMDITIQSYTAGLSAYPDMGQAEIEALFQQGLDPSKNIAPEVTTLTQGHESVIADIDTNRTTAACQLSVVLRAGAIFSWAYGLPAQNWFPYIASVTVYNVFANFVLSCDVAVKTGAAPPATNPWDMLILILDDLAFRLMDMAQSSFWLVLLIALAVVGCGAFLILRRKRR